MYMRRPRGGGGVTRTRFQYACLLRKRRFIPKREVLADVIFVETSTNFCFCQLNGVQINKILCKVQRVFSGGGGSHRL